MGLFYRPILKGREGEFDALGQAAERTWKSTMPLLELVPTTARGSSGGARRACQDFRDRLRDTMRLGMRIAVDTAAVPADGTLVHGGGVLLDLLTEISAMAEVVPVVRLDDPAAVDDVVRAGAEHGVLVRVRPDQLGTDELGDLLRRLAAEADVQKSRVDLVVDFGPVGSRTARAAVSDAVVRVLDDDGWRSRTVAGGAFPRDLASVQPWELTEIPRHEVSLWSRLRREIGAGLDFGDYAVAHPLPSGRGSAPPPQLRYAVQDRWLVIKGDRHRPQQFFEVCRRIRSHPEFTGQLGSADRSIAGRAENGPAGGQGAGTGSTWRALSTAHHLDFVVDHGTTHGEP